LHSWSLGRTELARLTPAKVRAWYNGLAKRYASVADDAYRVLRAVMNTAIADGLLVKSPCTVKGAGSVRAPERPTTTPQEALEGLDATPERYRAAIVLAAWCQLRRGEILALQRRHVDVERAVVTVRQSFSVPHNKKPVLGPPKSEAGARALTVPGAVLSFLEHHLDRFVAPGPEAWLFATAKGGPLSPRNFQRVWQAAREAVGRPDLHLHDLRHSGLTWSEISDVASTASFG
jgi:integrase